jgi:hypothetical protein
MQRDLNKYKEIFNNNKYYKLPNLSISKLSPTFYKLILTIIKRAAAALGERFRLYCYDVIEFLRQRFAERMVVVLWQNSLLTY